MGLGESGPGTWCSIMLGMCYCFCTYWFVVIIRTRIKTGAFILFSFLISCLSSKYLLWARANRIDSRSMHSEPGEDFCEQVQTSSRWDKYYFLWGSDHSLPWSQWSRKDNYHVSLFFYKEQIQGSALLLEQCFLFTLPLSLYYPWSWLDTQHEVFSRQGNAAPRHKEGILD